MANITRRHRCDHRLPGGLAEQDASYYGLLNEAAGLIEEHEGLEPTKPVRNWRNKELIGTPGGVAGVAGGVNLTLAALAVSAAAAKTTRKSKSPARRIDR